MADGKNDKIVKATLATSATREATIKVVRAMMRDVRPHPQHKSVDAFRSQIEFHTVLPEVEAGKLNDTLHVYDITFNADKLPELVSQYQQTHNPYALKVLLTIFDNALWFSRPIPEPMVDLVRQWVHGERPKKKKASDPLKLSRNASLIIAVKMLLDCADILPTRNTDKKPTAKIHTNTGCDIAARIWNETAKERNFPTATYTVAEEVWKAYRRTVGGITPKHKHYAQ